MIQGLKNIFRSRLVEIEEIEKNYKIDLGAKIGAKLGLLANLISILIHIYMYTEGPTRPFKIYAEIDPLYGQDEEGLRLYFSNGEAVGYLCKYLAGDDCLKYVIEMLN